jgi:transcriptional regulator with XRE-family HTH domain
LRAVKLKSQFSAIFDEFFMIDLKLRIKEARKHAGLTQPKLAELIGVSHRTLTSYEKDASKVTVKISQKIATVCKINEIWLLTGHGKMLDDSAEKEKNKETPNNLTRVVIEHQDMVKRFKNPERGLIWNKRLVDIEDVSEELCDKVDNYLKGVHDAAETIKNISKKNHLEESSEKKQVNGE